MSSPPLQTSLSQSYYTHHLIFVKYGKTRQSNQCGFCIYLLDDWSGLVWKVNQDDLDSEYEGFDGFTEDSSVAYLAIMPLFIYSRIVRCHACPQAPVERRAIICLERICKKRQKRTKVYFRNAKKTFCLNFFYFCRYRLNQVLRSSEQLLSNKLVSLFAKSLESQVEVVEFDLEALLRVYTYESTDSN